MPNIPNRQNWLFKETKIQPLSKDELINHYVARKFAITSQMFEYENLPETMSRRDIEYLIQTKGYGVACKVNGKPYILLGSFAGRLNEQYLPTQVIVTNPYLDFNETLDIDKNCVIIKNDSSYQGLMPLALEYSTLLAETNISLKYASWNTRIVQLLTASDDSTKKSAEEAIKRIVEGKEFAVIGTKPLIDSFNSYPYGGTTNNSITNLLELHQYLKANWYIDLGVNANYNMKRESLSENEVSVNEDTLLPLADDMLQCREEAVEKINEMFGLNIKVKVSSVWFKIKKEAELSIERQEAEIEAEKGELQEDKQEEPEKDEDTSKKTKEGDEE